MIFNYGLFIGLSKGIIYVFSKIGKICKYIKEVDNENNEEILSKRTFYTNNFIILFLQYSFIISLTVVGFKFNFHELLIELDISFFLKYILLIIFIILLSML